MHNIAIIVCAGNSTRMGLKKSKLQINLCGKTVLQRSIDIFYNLDFINEIYVVCRQTDLHEFKNILNQYDVNFVIGGESRSESVFNAVKKIEKCNYIFIHDGARPLTLKEDVYKAYNTAKKYGGAALGTPVIDTIKIVDTDMKIINTPQRENLYAVQTPQIFNFEEFKKLISKSMSNNKQYTDDCALFEAEGKNCYIVKGSYENIKITTEKDIAVAESIIKKRNEL